MLIVPVNNCFLLPHKMFVGNNAPSFFPLANILNSGSQRKEKSVMYWQELHTQLSSINTYAQMCIKQRIILL